MHLPAHEFVKPRTLAESLDVLRQAGNVKLIAGGTDVTFNMRGRLFQPDVLLSVRGLDELSGVGVDGDGWLRVGAATRLTDIENAPALGDWPMLRKACRSVASRHVRNMATLGGNLCLDTRCWYTNQTAEWRQARGPCLKNGVEACHAIKTSPVCVALNASDIAPALIALDAEILLASADNERRLPLADFYTADGVHHTVRKSDELLVAVRVPPTADATVYIKETARKGNDFSYAVIAGRKTDERVSKLVLGCLSMRPIQLTGVLDVLGSGELTEALIDQAADACRAELGVLTNLYTPAAYKAGLARALVRRALQTLKET